MTSPMRAAAKQNFERGLQDVPLCLPEMSAPVARDSRRMTELQQTVTPEEAGLLARLRDQPEVVREVSAEVAKAKQDLQTAADIKQAVDPGAMIGGSDHGDA